MIFQLLREVSEGWHIEYKNVFPIWLRFGKSINSLANTYDGWIC